VGRAALIRRVRHLLPKGEGLFSYFGQQCAQRGSAQTSTAPETQKLESVFTALRNRNARDYAVTGANAIDDSRYVEIGGIEQWITIRGEDRRNPVLLFLHGGPGDATNPWGYVTFRSWLKAFTVVQWDQRGAGRTLGKNGASSAPSITVAHMAQDGIELAEFLRKTLQKDKIIVVGHSFGSILGVFMVKSRPDLFYAFVGTGQVADPVRNYAVGYNFRACRRVSWNHVRPRATNAWLHPEGRERLDRWAGLERSASGARGQCARQKAVGR
jgi:pimeloyl-ACP methyl ester carboxylesterase